LITADIPTSRTTHSRSSCANLADFSSCSSGASSFVTGLSSIGSVEHAIRSRPTFFQHYSGLLLDWQYLHQRELSTLAHESVWIAQQHADIWVDLTSGLDLFPGLRLINNSAPDIYARSLTVILDVMDKMVVTGIQDLVFSLHRVPENNIDRDTTLVEMATTLTTLVQWAQTRAIRLHLRQAFKNPFNTLSDMDGWLHDHNLQDDIHLAISTSLLIANGVTPDDLMPMFDAGRISMVLLACPAFDIMGDLFDDSARLTASSINAASCQSEIPGWVSTAVTLNLMMAFDATYEDANQEYKDAALVSNLS